MARNVGLARPMLEIVCRIIRHQEVNVVIRLMSVVRDAVLFQIKATGVVASTRIQTTGAL